MAAQKILFIVGDFVEDYEVMVPYQMLQMVGHDCVAASPGKAAGDYVITAIHDFEGHQTYSEKPGHRFNLNATWDDLNAADFDALVLPGGRAPEFLRLDETVLSIVRHFAENDKPIAAICHGPQILSAAGVLHGKSCCCYPAVGPEVSAAKATYIAANAGANNAHTDGKLVTAPAWPAHPAWMRQFLTVLGSKLEP